MQSTADGQGLEDGGNGAGALIEQAASQIKHMLVNWVYGDYKSGLWLADSTAPVDASAFAAHAARYTGAKGSRRILTSQKTLPIDEINAWAKSWEARLHWNNRGDLSVAIDPIQQIPLYLDETWLRYDGHRPMSISLSPDWDGIISSVTAQHKYGETAGKYLEVFEAQDPTATLELPDSVELRWAAAS